ncbi:phage minor head protein, partial [Candidatus Sarmatiella mevalonica]|uniref:phage minor head protein n=1 Tax=Candidatus Sarmatiella mevalonica TaxID=2770581 RepID=UPI002445B584
MIKIYNKAYTSAFWKYLRYGSKITEPYYVFKSANGIENDMKFYIWRTKEDHKVRPTHAANNGKVFSYNKPPPTGHPGRAINCRCHDEAIHATFDGDENSVSKYDIDTWPTVPINGKLIEGLPSKAKPRSRGEKSLYDIYGGEWKPHTIDPRHNLHWDYKGRDRCDEWMNIPINGKVPKIIEKSVYKSFKYKEANMLRVRCFDDFDNGPQILIAGMHEDYRHTAQYLSK